MPEQTFVGRCPFCSLGNPESRGVVIKNGYEPVELEPPQLGESHDESIRRKAKYMIRQREAEEKASTTHPVYGCGLGKVGEECMIVKAYEMAARASEKDVMDLKFTI